MPLPRVKEPDEPAHCRSCGAPVIIAYKTDGKAIPLNTGNTTVFLYAGEEFWKAVWEKAASADGGWITVTGHLTHFATCPDAEMWRKKGEEALGERKGGEDVVPAK